MQINIPLDGANPAMITSEGNAASFLVLEPTKKKKERENLSTGVVPKRPTAGYTIAQKKKYSTITRVTIRTHWRFIETENKKKARKRERKWGEQNDKHPATICY